MIADLLKALFLGLVEGITESLPTLGMASVFDLITSLNRLTTSDLLLMALGLVAAFVTSLLVIGWLLRYVATHDFRPFAYYRIVAGLIIITWSL